MLLADKVSIPLETDLILRFVHIIRLKFMHTISAHAVLYMYNVI